METAFILLKTEPAREREVYSALIEVPDLVITGGASGVDYLAERWAENNNVPHVVFNEEWGIPREGLEDMIYSQLLNVRPQKI